MQFIDLSAQYNAIKPQIDDAIQAVLNHNQFIMGPEVARFEQELAAYIGVKHCISCGNGTDAIQLLLMAWNIGEGDALFCPDVTFFASAEPACMLGATPVFCDVDAKTYNISPESLVRQIEAVKKEGKLKPRLVVAVDLFGQPADLDALRAVCDEHGLLLLEDAAQSIGGSYKGKRCGSFGDAAATSFFPSKPLGCYGDGGAVFTNDDALADLVRSLRVHGKSAKGKYHNERVGLNSRLDTIQAAVLSEKLKALQEFEADARQKAAAYYNKGLAGKVTIPFVAEDCTSIYAQYTLLAKDAAQRERIMESLKAKGIPVLVHYPVPQHKLPFFAGINLYDEEFAVANDYCERTFSVPMHPYITQAEMDEVITAVGEGL